MIAEMKVSLHRIKDSSIDRAVQYDLPNTMAHHKKKNVEIEVDLLRFERIAPRNA